MGTPGICGVAKKVSIGYKSTFDIRAENSGPKAALVSDFYCIYIF